jgi:hypothetical protein
VHADIPHQEVILREDVDPTMSPMKTKDIGELVLCGVAAAVANAIYNTIGEKVARILLTCDKLGSLVALCLDAFARKQPLHPRRTLLEPNNLTQYVPLILVQ